MAEEKARSVPTRAKAPERTASRTASRTRSLAPDSSIVSSSFDINSFCQENPNAPECITSETGVTGVPLDSPSDYCKRFPNTAACREFDAIKEQQTSNGGVAEASVDIPTPYNNTVISTDVPIGLTVQGKNLEFRQPDRVPVDDIKTIYTHQEVKNNFDLPEAPLKMQMGVAHYGQADLSANCNPAPLKRELPTDMGGTLNQVVKARNLSNTYKQSSPYGDLDVYKRSIANPLDYL